MKKTLIIIFIFITAFTLTGCWNYKEVNDIWMVSGLAIDWDKQNEKYIISSEIIKPVNGEEGSITSEVITFESYTIFDAMRKSISISGKKLYWSHCYVVIISEPIAEKGIGSILDLISRSGEFRTNIVFMVSKEKTAKEMLEKKMKLFDIASFQLDDMVKSYDKLSNSWNSEMWNFRKDYFDEGISPIMTAVRLSESNGKILPQIYGCGVFKEDKLIGYIDNIEMESLLLVRNSLKGGDIPIKNMDNTKAAITLEILSSKTELEPKIQGDDITMNINIKLNVAIPELEVKENIINEKDLANLKDYTNGKVEEQILAFVLKCQTKLKCDILGYGKLIQKKEPSKWKMLEKNWDEEFQTVKTNVNVETNIISSYRLYKTITAGD